MIPLCRDQGVAVIPYSPLARGLLARPAGDARETARAKSDPLRQQLALEPGDRDILDAVAAVGVNRGVPFAQIALAWVIANPFVTAPIVGATRPQHLEDAAAAATLTLTSNELARLEAQYLPHRVEVDDPRGKYDGPRPLRPDGSPCRA